MTELHGEGSPERRRVMPIQRISLAIEGSLLLAMVSLVFWVGQQAQILKDLVQSRNRTEVKIESVNEKVTHLSGQILQASSAAAVSNVEARTQVLEARMDAADQSMKDIRDDLKQRFDRLERLVQSTSR
jgi:hypothetical protein